MDAPKLDAQKLEDLRSLAQERIDAARAALSGRTVSCGNETMARERDSLKQLVRRAQEMVFDCKPTAGGHYTSAS
jgi:hypothetical protein